MNETQRSDRAYAAAFDTNELLDEADAMLAALKEHVETTSGMDIIYGARALIAEYQRRAKK